MNYLLLGNSALRVSEIALGTMTFGGDDGVWAWGVDEATSNDILTAYLEEGGNFLDTADMYTDGRSETIVGQYLADHGLRPSVVLATKYTNHAPGVEYPGETGGTHANAAGNHRKNLVQSVETSLRRLKTDYIDLLWVHAPDYLTPTEEILRAVDDLVRQGKILHLGLSDFPAWMVSRAQATAELRGWTAPTAIQILYNLNERTPEREYLPMAKALNVGVMAWGPLGGGLLTGKYDETDIVSEDSTLPEGVQTGAAGKSKDGIQRRMDVMGIGHSYLVNETGIEITNTVKSVAGRIVVTPGQVAIAWLQAQGVIPIVGATSAEQIRENLKAVNVTLSKTDLAELDAVSRIDLGFPHQFVATAWDIIYGGYKEQIPALSREDLGDAFRLQAKINGSA